MREEKPHEQAVHERKVLSDGFTAFKDAFARRYYIEEDGCK
jgi:hypothetical protein